MKLCMNGCLCKPIEIYTLYSQICSGQYIHRKNLKNRHQTANLLMLISARGIDGVQVQN
jgi:hypothetical protein